MCPQYQNPILVEDVLPLPLEGPTLVYVLTIVQHKRLFLLVQLILGTLTQSKFENSKNPQIFKIDNFSLKIHQDGDIDLHE